MARRSRRRQGSVWTQLEESPRSGLPDAARIARRQRLYRVVVWASLVMAPLASFAWLSTLTSPQATSDIAAGQVASSDGRAVATVALDDWLDSETAVLDDVRVLSWDGSSTVHSPAAEDSGDSAATLTVESFTVIDGAGNLYRVELLVASTPDDGPAVISEPSLIPIAPSTGSASSAPWPGRASVATSDSVGKAVEVWAEAFASGDPDALKLTTGDPDVDSVFAPLPALEVVETSVSSATPFDSGGTDTIIARVAVTVRPIRSSTTTTTAAGSGDTTSTLHFDVLVERASTAAPIVVAWGAPGSGPTLERYVNAVTGDRPAPATTTTTSTSKNATSTTVGSGDG